MDLVVGESVRIDEVAIRLEGGVRRASVVAGSHTMPVRGTRGSADVTELVEQSGFRLTAAVDIDVEQLAPGLGRGDRGNVGPARIVLDAPPLAADEEAQVALVHENGELRWIFPSGDGQRYVLDVGDSMATDRGLLGTAIRKGIKFLAVKAVKPVAGRVIESLAAAAEARIRPSRLRTFGVDDYRSEAVAPDLDRIAAGPALLFIHGTNSSTLSGFGRIPEDWVRRIGDQYDGRVFAFDHPSISVTPDVNADVFAELVREARPDGGRDLELDVIAHSRGGLVARELAERPRAGVGVRSITFVATPNLGTPLASAQHLGSFVDVLTNLAAVVPDNPITDALEVIFELVKDIALDIAFDSLPGIKAMTPDGEYLRALNEATRPAGLVYRAVAADFEPLNTASQLARLRDRLFDRVFDGAMNDLVVPTRSVYRQEGGFFVDARERIVLDSTRSVSHSTFWSEPDVMNRIGSWFEAFHRGDWPPPQPLGDPAKSDPQADIEAAMDTGDGDAVLEALEMVADLPSKFTEVIAQITGGPVRRPLTTGRAAGDVVLLPGIMGSLIETGDGPVWISPWNLGRGAFTTLTLDRPTHTARATGLNMAYVQLASQLARRWRVHLFPFDWRVDIDESADRLNEFITGKVLAGGDRPVHLVAHSMGGLVARSFIHRHTDTWDRIDHGDDHSSGGRLLMLGTPNLGSYAIALALAGEDTVVKGLAAVDLRNSRSDLSRVVATFPGMYQMLPAPGLDIVDDRQRLFDASGWPDGVMVDPDLLHGAEQFHQRMAAGHENADTERMVYVAGDKHRTPGRIRIERGEHHFGMTDEGDGRVLHSASRLDGVTNYFSLAGHGALVTDETVLGAVDELLTTGSTDALNTTSFPRRGSVDGLTEGLTSPVVSARDVDPGPLLVASRGRSGAIERGDLASVMAESMSAYVAQPVPARTGQRTLRIGVSHASLEQAKHPVIVGHYRGIPPEGAEAFLDWRLGKALSLRFEANDYPDEPGDALFVQSLAQQRPPGGIVIGLGDFGELTRAKLVRSVRTAAVQRVLRANDRGESGPKGVSSVLVGTPGQYDLSIGVATGAIVEGFARAALDTASMQLDVYLEHLEIIELYEARAISAAKQLRTVVDSIPVDLVNAVQIHVERRLKSGRGGRPGLPTRENSGAWPRFVIERRLPPCPPANNETADDDRDNEADYPCADVIESPRSTMPSLEFTQLGRGAQVDRLAVEFDDAKITRLIRAAVGSPTTVDESYALFEMLFPHQQKLELDDTDNLHLLVDEDSAFIPWELLYGRDDGHLGQALALRTGMLRQIRPGRGAEPVRRNGRRPEGNRALVIGDPPAGEGFPRLPGARTEAREVARMLTEHGYEVTDLVFGEDEEPDGDAWLQIQAALYRHRYRVIHLAAHGEIDEIRPERSGLLLAPKVRLTALDLRQMSATPDLVFINACHVGRTSTGVGTGRTPQRANEIAANLALQLMRNGVRAVIAAGWAVDDQAALRFARGAYDSLLDGQHYGEAIRKARVCAYDNGRSNTWGAYQCYGDPSFSLSRLSSVSTTDLTVSPRDLIERLQICRQQASDATQIASLRNVHDTVKATDANDIDHFPAPDVYESLGRVFGDLGCHDDAVWAYLQAIEVDNGEGRVSLHAIEQLANMRVRLAAQVRRGRPSRFDAIHPSADPPSDLFDRAESDLRRLIGFEVTAERRSLLGSLYKKRAAVMTARTRAGSLASAIEEYRRALDLRLSQRLKIDPYSGCNWVQLSRLADPDGALPLQQAILLLIEYATLAGLRPIADDPVVLDVVQLALNDPDAALDTEALERVGEFVGRSSDADHIGGDSEPAEDFWEDVGAGDLALTRYMFEATQSDPTEPQTSHLVAATGHYLTAFRNRSAVRNRDSVVDHLRDLVEIASEDHPLGKHLSTLIDQLDEMVATELEAHNL